MEHGVGTDMQHSRRVANPTGIEAHVNDMLLHLRHTPSVAVVEEKTAFDTRRVLAEVALGATVCFATFDHRLTAPVRAGDRDQCDAPLSWLWETSTSGAV